MRGLLPWLLVLVCLVAESKAKHSRKIFKGPRFDLKKPFFVRKPPFKTNKHPFLHTNRYGRQVSRPKVSGPAQPQRPPRKLQDNRWDPIGLLYSKPGYPPAKPVFKKPVFKKPVYPKKPLVSKKRKDFRRKPVLRTGDISRIDVVRRPPPQRQNQNILYQQQQQQYQQQQQKYQEKQQQQNQQQLLLQQQQQQYIQQQQQQQQQQKEVQQQQQELLQLQPQQQQTIKSQQDVYESNGLKIFKFRGVEGRGNYKQDDIVRLNFGESRPSPSVSWSKAQVFGSALSVNAQTNFVPPPDFQNGPSSHPHASLGGHTNPPPTFQYVPPSSPLQRIDFGGDLPFETVCVKNCGGKLN